MKHFSPQNAITRQARQFIAFGFSGFAFGALLLAGGTIVPRFPIATTGSSSEQMVRSIGTFMSILGVVLLLVGLAAMIRGATFRRDNLLAQRVGETLAPLLNNDYTFIRNINKLRLGYIDAVLIGPPGMLVFRIVEQSGTFLHEGDRWLRPGTTGQWLPAPFNATQECTTDIRALRQFLVRNNLPIQDAVFGVAVLISDPGTTITEKQPLMPGTTLANLHERIRRGFLAQPRISPEQAAAVVKVLRN
jgi:hypothetical protein